MELGLLGIPYRAPASSFIWVIGMYITKCSVTMHFVPRPPLRLPSLQIFDLARRVDVSNSPANILRNIRHVRPRHVLALPPLAPCRPPPHPPHSLVPVGTRCRAYLGLGRERRRSDGAPPSHLPRQSRERLSTRGIVRTAAPRNAGGHGQAEEAHLDRVRQAQQRSAACASTCGAAG